ncbi:MAG: cation diffusion facilitator family transporter [Bacillus sp. (in: firmicutes)]
MSKDQALEKLAQRGAWISIIAYLLMAAFKLSIGYFGHSEGLWADGLNNSTDIIASAAVLIGLKIAIKPPDEDHLYGHTRAETVASLIAAFIMMTVGFSVIVQAFQSLLNEGNEAPSMMTAAAAAISSLFMFGIYKYNKQLSIKTNNASLFAVAKDNLSDALVSAGALVGIVGTWIGVPWLDTVAALVVGFIICKTAWDIFSDASHSLTDGFDQDLLASIKKTILATPGVLYACDLKGRMHGNKILIEATIQVDKSLNVVDSHRISENVEKELLEEYGIHHALIHVEPYLE